MNVVEALKKIKLMQGQIKRLISIREDAFSVVIPKDISLEEALKEKKKYNIVGFEDITAKIDALSREITALREKLLITNVSTILSEGYSLAKLKLMIDEMRSELAQLNALIPSRRRSLFDSRKLRSSEDEEKEIPQLNALQIEGKIQSLEDKKGVLEAKLEKANANTKLLDSLSH